MEYKNGKEIKETLEIGTRKYIICINKRYFVDFKEKEQKRGNGSYSREGFEGLQAQYPADIIVVSDEIEEAKVIDGRINLKSYIDKIFKNYEYKFNNIEIIEIEDNQKC